MILLDSSQDVAVFLSADPVAVDFTTFNRDFDQDGEWAEQTDPRDPAATPAPPSDLSPLGA